MKKIYKAIVLLGFTAVLGTSCNDWLNVYPSDQIKEEYLFETGNGYRTALNGIYRKMTAFSIYGSNLKWGIIDAWGQVYDMNKSRFEAGGRPMQRIEKLEFKHLDLVPTTDQMWNDSWNVVANCNELVQQTEKADSMLFFGKELERRMILGEAIGLRAYVQFDLLRVYAPSPAMLPGKRTFIPYVNTYPAYVNEHQTVDYCLEQIIKDLKRAQELLLDVDKDFYTNRRFTEMKNDEIMFKESRGFRLNYYAITAMLARVYLYAGKPDEALAQANIVIQNSNYFEAITDTKTGIKAIKNGNTKMFDDVIFALYSPTDQVEWDRQINHSADSNNSPDDESFLGLSLKMAEDMYGSDLTTDWRALHQLEQRGVYYRSLKYYQQLEVDKIGKTNNQIVPMFRMSEVYYIAAEALYRKGEEGLKTAQGYLETVKAGRGLKVKVTETGTLFMDELIKDARREFLGEGQTFFMLKRMLKPMKGRDEVPANEQNMVLPLPDSESTI